LVKPTPSANKLRGGYYTPGPIADFLVKWAVRAPGASVLEPSAGDGVFLRAAAARLLELGGETGRVSITAIEVDRTAAHLVEWRRLYRAGALSGLPSRLYTIRDYGGDVEEVVRRAGRPSVPNEIDGTR
jgi:hypothetical protein